MNVTHLAPRGTRTRARGQRVVFAQYLFQGLELVAPPTHIRRCPLACINQCASLRKHSPSTYVTLFTSLLLELALPQNSFPLLWFEVVQEQVNNSAHGPVKTVDFESGPTRRSMKNTLDRSTRRSAQRSVHRSHTGFAQGALFHCARRCSTRPHSTRASALGTSRAKQRSVGVGLIARAAWPGNGKVLIVASL